MPFRTHQVLGSVGMRESVGLRGAEDRLGVNGFIFHIHISLWARSLLVFSSHHAVADEAI